MEARDVLLSYLLGQGCSVRQVDSRSLEVICSVFELSLVRSFNRDSLDDDVVDFSDIPSI
jgi:hypothetical protein